jgi:hypothetical protein
VSILFGSTSRRDGEDKLALRCLPVLNKSAYRQPQFPVDDNRLPADGGFLIVGLLSPSRETLKVVQYSGGKLGSKGRMRTIFDTLTGILNWMLRGLNSLCGI